MTVLLEARELRIERGERQLCTALDLRIESTQSWALLGRNGAGKTTLLHTLAGLHMPAAGSITCAEQALHTLPPRARAQHIAVLLQHSGPGFGASVLETVLTGRHPHLGAFSWESRDDIAIATRCLAIAGVEGLAQRPLTTLSGGELRRVEIARVLAQQAPLALFDEPFNHLDIAHQAAILRALRTHCVGPANAMLMVVHDLNIAWHACTHWLLLDGHGGWHAGPRDTVAERVLREPLLGHPVERLGEGERAVFRIPLD